MAECTYNFDPDTTRSAHNEPDTPSLLFYGDPSSTFPISARGSSFSIGSLNPDFPPSFQAPYLLTMLDSSQPDTLTRQGSPPPPTVDAVNESPHDKRPLSTYSSYDDVYATCTPGIKRTATSDHFPQSIPPLNLRIQAPSSETGFLHTNGPVSTPSRSNDHEHSAVPRGYIGTTKPLTAPYFSPWNTSPLYSIADVTYVPAGANHSPASPTRRFRAIQRSRAQQKSSVPYDQAKGDNNPVRTRKMDKQSSCWWCNTTLLWKGLSPRHNHAFAVPSPASFIKQFFR